MMKTIFQVDAFTDKCFGGNPAGVVLDAEGLSEDQMLLIAREMNLSETAFVFKTLESDFDYIVRFFTPTQEVDLCGHATIATFYAMCNNENIHTEHSKIIIKQKTRAGILPVELNFDNHELESVMMKQSTPTFYDTTIEIQKLADIMGVDRGMVGVKGFDVLPQIVSTGLRDIILPVKNLSTLKMIKPDLNRLAAYNDELNVTGVHAFTLETQETESQLACRNFAPAVGIDEEAATGTSNGALGAYLVKKNIFSLENSMKIICEQGYYMNRPSKIIVEIEGTKDEMSIKVGGKAVIVFEGKLNL